MLMDGLMVGLAARELGPGTKGTTLSFPLSQGVLPVRNEKLV